MTYDTDLEQRIDKLTAGWTIPLVKKKMFGGFCYMLHGNLCFGSSKDELLVRATEEQTKEFLKQPGMHEFRMSHRPAKTWFNAGGEAIKPDYSLVKLLEVGCDYALSLPPKEK